VEKYRFFMERFPDAATLAAAPVAELLAVWQGLGYNRRALNLQNAARMIMAQWQGVLPPDPQLLKTLPGIGPYTAAAVCVFAFNLPVPLIETNIRAVYIHCFFADRNDVSDKELMPLIEATFDRTNPRQWCNTLMDYGAMLKRSMPNPSRRSAHHTRQSAFHGSHRQLRGKLLKLLLNGPASSFDLAETLNEPVERLQPALEQLAEEGFLREEGPTWIVAERRL
jgi:A/G-specific adenine glycosylase